MLALISGTSLANTCTTVIVEGGWGQERVFLLFVLIKRGIKLLLNNYIALHRAKGRKINSV